MKKKKKPVKPTIIDCPCVMCQEGRRMKKGIVRQ